MTIGKKLTMAMAAMFVCAAALSYVGLSAIGTFKELFDNTVEKTVHKMALADAIIAANSEMIAAQRGIILGAFSRDLAESQQQQSEFRQGAESLRNSVAEMQPMVAREEAKQLLADIARLEAEWQPHYQELVSQSVAGNGAEAARIRKDLIVPISGRITAAAQRLTAIENEVLRADQASVGDVVGRNRWITLALLGLAMVLGAVVQVLVRKTNHDLRVSARDVLTGAEEVAGAASQVTVSSESLAQGASEQAASLQEISSSTEEVSSMAHKNGENSSSAAERVTQAGEKFDAANQSLSQMVVAMGEISAHSEKISKIIKVIDEIAFQTNILALNAAVEAARAGEAGMGFAVVADEVRNLAQRCAQAARDTAVLIEESVAKSNEGKAKVDQVAAAVCAISEDAAQVKTLVEEVNLGSQEQARGIEQVAKAITQVERVTQQAAASAEESASAAEELNAQSASLKDVAGRLAAIVGHAEDTHSGSRAQAPARRSGKPALAVRKTNPTQTVAKTAEQDPLPMGEFKEF